MEEYERIAEKEAEEEERELRWSRRKGKDEERMQRMGGVREDIEWSGGGGWWLRIFHHLHTVVHSGHHAISSLCAIIGRNAIQLSNCHQLT